MDKGSGNKDNVLNENSNEACSLDSEHEAEIRLQAQSVGHTLHREEPLRTMDRPGAYNIMIPVGATQFSEQQQQQQQQVSAVQQQAMDFVIVEGVLVNEDGDGQNIDPTMVESYLQTMLRESQSAEVIGVGALPSYPKPQDERSTTSTGSHPMEEGQSPQRHCFVLVAVCVLLMTAVAAAVGVTAGDACLGSHCKENEWGHNLTPRNHATNSSTTSGDVLTEEGIPSVTFGAAFTSTEELYSAVDNYLHDNSPNSSIAAKYGFPIGSWNVSLISNFSYLFSNKRNPDLEYFDADLSNWDVSQATTLEGLFLGATSFKTGNLSSWDVSNVVDMTSLFEKARIFKGNNLENWNVGRVTSMRSMFRQAKNFTGNLASWDVGSVRDMTSMFEKTRSFGSDLSLWDTSAVTSMVLMFHKTLAFYGDLSLWNTSAVTSMAAMFQHSTHFGGDFSRWDMSNVRSIANMFDGAISFQSDLSSWNVESISDMSFAFQRANSFNSDLSGWDVSGVLTMRSMFRDASHFNSNLTSWIVSRTKDMANMFSGASSFNQNLCSWGTRVRNKSAVVTQGMFLGSGCPEEKEPMFESGSFGGSMCHQCRR